MLTLTVFSAPAVHAETAAGVRASHLTQPWGCARLAAPGGLLVPKGTLNTAAVAPSCLCCLPSNPKPHIAPAVFAMSCNLVPSVCELQMN